MNTNEHESTGSPRLAHWWPPMSGRRPPRILSLLLLFRGRRRRLLVVHHVPVPDRRLPFVFLIILVLYGHPDMHVVPVREVQNVIRVRVRRKPVFAIDLP